MFFIMCEHLINGYNEFYDVRYLNKALDFLWDWKKHNFTESKSEMA